MDDHVFRPRQRLLECPWRGVVISGVQVRIDLWDEVGVQARGEVASEPEVFEAAWGGDGAVYLARPRWSDDVADVFRLCPERLRGHTSRELDIPPGEISKRFPGALLFNSSTPASSATPTG